LVTINELVDIAFGLEKTHRWIFDEMRSGAAPATR
jgi:hypothetical protein